MENASKALLIAGSILIVILLIAAGVKVFDSTSGTKDSVEETMTSTEVVNFNNKFMPYIGGTKTKAEIISLINAIIANNVSSNFKIKVIYSGSGDRAENINDLNTLLQNISNSPSKNFKIDPRKVKYDNYGHISEIKIDNS